MQSSSSFQYQTFPAMSVSGIQGQVLEVTVVGCNKLKDTEWISRQDPYVCLEYGSTKFRTRTCTDGGKNPIFQEKFVFTLIEGLQEFNAVVWNSNTLTFDDYIGNGKIQLHKVLSQGYDDTAWPLHTKTGRHSGEIRLILHYSNAANKMTANYSPSPVQQYMTPHVPLYASPPPGAGGPYYQTTVYPNPSPYPTSSYLTNPAPYPPTTAYHLQPSAYSLQPYPPTAYPPQPYPPPPQPTSYYPPGPYMGTYPPPPY